MGVCGVPVVAAPAAIDEVAGETDAGSDDAPSSKSKKS